MSTFYIIRDEGRLVGYTQSSTTAKTFIRQRNHERYELEKVDKDDIPSEVRRAMNEVYMEPEELYGIYLLQEEYEDTLDCVTRNMNSLYSSCDGIRYVNQFLKHKNEEQEEVMATFEKMGKAIIDVIDLVISTGEPDIYKEVIDMSRMVSDILKEKGRMKS